MLRLHRLLWFSYLISMPVVSAFSLTQAVNAPLILSAVLIFPLISNDRIYFDKNAIILLFVFCTPIVFSAAVNFNSALEPKFINHALSYFVVYFLFYLIPRQYLRYFRDDKIGNPIAFGWSLAVIFGLIEFLLVNFFAIDFSNYIPRAEVVDYMPTVEGIIIRARSFAEESAHFMIYAGIFYYILRYYKKVNFVLTYFFVAAMIVSFGVAAWIAFLIAEIYRFTRNSQRLNFKRVVISIFIFGSLVWYFFDFFDTFIFGVLIDKFTSSSSEQRMELFLDHASIFFN